MPATMIIMPATKMIVDQLMPVLPLSPSAFAYQKTGVPIARRFSVSMMADPECMIAPKTTASMSPPLTRVTHCRSNLSVMMSANMAMKITRAAICASDILLPPFSAVRPRDTNRGNSTSNFLP